MRIYSGKELERFINGIIYAKKQVHENSVDLTMAKIFKVEREGSLDFGGSEFIQGEHKEITPVKKSDDDEYGWWNLKEGAYVIQFNESINLPNNVIGLIQSLDRLYLNGAVLIPITITGSNEKIKSILVVGEKGIKIKENARTSNLVVYS